MHMNHEDRQRLLNLHHQRLLNLSRRRNYTYDSPVLITVPSRSLPTTQGNLPSLSEVSDSDLSRLIPFYKARMDEYPPERSHDELRADMARNNTSTYVSKLDVFE